MSDHDGIRSDLLADHSEVKLDGTARRGECDVPLQKGGIVIDIRIEDRLEDLQGVVHGTELGAKTKHLEEHQGIPVLAGLDDQGVELRDLADGFAALQEGDELAHPMEGPTLFLGRMAS